MTQQRATELGSDHLGDDFELLWRSYALSKFGVAFSNGAIAIIAVQNLSASALQVAVVFGVSRLVAAVLSIPVGVIVEQREKRPVLITTDIVRSATTMLIPVLLWTNQLTIELLAIAMTVDAFLSIASASAAGAHLKDLVPRAEWSRGFSRLSTTDWIFTAIFTPLGGIVVSLVGPGITLSIDALTYIGAALILKRITSPERVPQKLDSSGIRELLSEVVGGWLYIWRTPPLRSLFNNAMLFGASLVVISPLLAVLVLRGLELAAWQYTTILGVPALGGVLGSALAPRIEHRWSSRSTLLAFGATRTCWTVWIAFSPPGLVGFLLILAAEFFLMFFAGVFNPIFVAYQAALTHDDYMARMSAAWRASAMTAQPVFMLIGGVAAGVIGLRETIALAGVLMVASSFLLPWRTIGGIEVEGQSSVS